MAVCCAGAAGRADAPHWSLDRLRRDDLFGQASANAFLAHWAYAPGLLGLRKGTDGPMQAQPNENPNAQGSRRPGALRSGRRGSSSPYGGTIPPQEFISDRARLSPGTKRASSSATHLGPSKPRPSPGKTDSACSRVVARHRRRAHSSNTNLGLHIDINNLRGPPTASRCEPSLLGGTGGDPKRIGSVNSATMPTSTK